MKQTEENWEAFIILDNPKDRSFPLAMQLSAREPRIQIRKNNERKGLARNMWRGIKLSKPKKEDVICILDADDIIKKNALKIVGKAYGKNKNCLLTYGSFVKKSNGKRVRSMGKYPPSAQVRRSRWKASHFKTFKYKLFKKLPKTEFLHHGEWLEAASDLALMIPLIEMAGLSRTTFISEVIYVWRDNYKYSTNKKKQKKCKKIILKKNPLRRINV